MKKILLIAVMAFSLFVAIPAFAHHAAEGIVADDIYEMIEENLAGTPHLDLDLTTMGSGQETMAVITVTVPESEVDEVLAIITDALKGEGF